ncbi:GntR family transcriptional regulator [Rhizobium halophytocola]|uniref:DNA-binding GntR family transcriptional regulator n=1 Tax=Rhizobium halophytocola TaxID=735519 RepID=A0ABS4DTD3_9HYPH|nr:GntR family transcriptional regulator [Rhizobium halophytocola]MBP1848943.1 DNA-binding GntR family transcriptional regulator [Rhizobium halophytocola]
MKPDRRDEAGGDNTVDVTDLILHDIQTGLLAPGSWLKQIDLEKRYGCARPEIRRALDRLTQKRIVEHVPNRGYHVFEPDGDQARQVSEVRLLLELGVAGRIIDNASAADITALNSLADQFDRLIMSGTTIELYEANLAFHHRLLSLCGNAELVKVVTEIRQRTSSAPVSQWTTRARIQQSSLEHYDMVRCLEMRDMDRLKALITQHIMQSGPDASA